VGILNWKFDKKEVRKVVWQRAVYVFLCTKMKKFETFSA